MSQSAKIGIILALAYSATEELSTLTDSLQQSRGETFKEGVGANEINLLYHDSRPLAAGGIAILNIHDGSLSNKVGQSITLDKLKGAYIKNNSIDSSLLIGGGPASSIEFFSASFHALKLRPGGEFLFLAPDVNGLDVTVKFTLTLTHGDEGSSAPDYDLVLVGVDVP